MSSLPSLERLLCELIAVRSVATDRQACAIALEICRNCIDDVPGVTVREYDIQGQPSLVALYNADRTPDILLICHADVVPAPPSAYAPEVVNGRVTGRGAIDMKGPTCAMIRAFHRHASAKGRLSLGLMITTDEEVGGQHGVQHLLTHEGYRPRCVLLPDAGYDFNVVTLQYGIIRVRVRRCGRAAHSSRPEDGDNAIESFQETYREFQEKMHSVPETVSTLVLIGGGIALNVVPDLCEATIDIRTANASDVLRLTESVFRPGEFEIITNEPSFNIDPKHPFVRTYRDVAARELGRPVNLEVLRGATDARFLAPFHIPVIVSAPRGGGHHEDGEWADLASLEQCEEIALKFLDALRLDVGSEA